MIIFIITIYCVVLLNTSNYISVSGQMYPSFLSPEINSNDIKLERIKIKSDDRFPNLFIGSGFKPAVHLNSENKLLNCLGKYVFQDKNFRNGEDDFFFSVLT